ncbi:cytoskeleton-associated protein 5, partial [Corchorus capsularis]
VGIFLRRSGLGWCRPSPPQLLHPHRLQLLDRTSATAAAYFNVTTAASHVHLAP